MMRVRLAFTPMRWSLIWLRRSIKIVSCVKEMTNERPVIPMMMMIIIMHTSRQNVCISWYVLCHQLSVNESCWQVDRKVSLCVLNHRHSSFQRERRTITAPLCSSIADTHTFLFFFASARKDQRRLFSSLYRRINIEQTATTRVQQRMINERTWRRSIDRSISAWYLMKFTCANALWHQSCVCVCVRTRARALFPLIIFE